MSNINPLVTPAITRQQLVNSNGWLTGEGIRFVNAILNLNILAPLAAGWQAWTPTVTPSGSMTASSVTVNDAQYIQLGAITFFKLSVSLTLAGTASNCVAFSLPMAAAGANSAISAEIEQSSAWSAAYGLVNVVGGTLQVYPSGQANFSLGAAAFLLSGAYRNT